MSGDKIDINGLMGRLRAGSQGGLEAGAITLQREIKRKLNSGGASNLGNGGASQSSAGQPPSKKSGNLSRSIQIDRTDIDNMNIRVGTNLVYARIQEFGGRVSAKRVKYLPIPIPGKEREAYRVRRAAGGSLRNADLEVRKSKRGNLVLGRMVGRGRGKLSQFEPLFVLKKSVVIRPHPYMRPGIANAKKSMGRSMARGFKAGFKARGAA